MRALRTSGPRDSSFLRPVGLGLSEDRSGSSPVLASSRASVARLVVPQVFSDVALG